MTYQELGLGYLDAGKTAQAIAAFEKARQTSRRSQTLQGARPHRRSSSRATSAEIDYNMKVATDADPVRFAGTRREVIEEAYEIYDKLSFVQPLPLGVRRIYADGCFNKAVYQERDGDQIDIGLLRKSEQYLGRIQQGVTGWI